MGVSFLSDEQTPPPYDEKSELGQSPEVSYEDIVFLAFIACNTPNAAVVLLEGEEIVVLAESGASLTRFSGGPALYALATLTARGVMTVPDLSKDARFGHNPLVLEGPRIRFYAGVALLGPHGEPIGSLCVVDTVPRELSQVQRGVLETLARQVTTLLLLRRQHEALERTNSLLAYQSVTDSLTGLLNRRGFEEQLAVELERARRYHLPLSLLMVDVDDFKPYNDAFGHPAGDQILSRLALLLKRSVRRVDVVARYGGEEFAIIAPESRLEDIRLLAERCRKTVEGASWTHRRVTVSIGVASWAPGDQDTSTLVEAADRALYRAKNGGRNRVVSDPSEENPPQEP